MLLLPPPKKDWRYDCYEAQNKQKGCTLVLLFAKTEGMYAGFIVCQDKLWTAIQASGARMHGFQISHGHTLTLTCLPSAAVLKQICPAVAAAVGGREQRPARARGQKQKRIPLLCVHICLWKPKRSTFAETGSGQI